MPSSNTLKKTPRNLVCPYCGKELPNYCDEQILSSLQKAPAGLSWNMWLKETKLAEGTLSTHLNSLIEKRKVQVTLKPNTRDGIYQVNKLDACL